MTHLHSVPAGVSGEPCETVASLPHPRLRPYVVGYAGFRSGSGAAIGHRVLPLNLATMIIDFATSSGSVTGPRSVSIVDERTGWGHGVSVGLNPAGTAALLGVPMRELAGGAARLEDVLARGKAESAAWLGDAELAKRLGEAPDWPARFAILDGLLDQRLTAAVAAGWRADGLLMHAWWRLQQSGDRLPIGILAKESGISRRNLELRFQRQVGLSPGTVARIARFQRAVGMLTRSSGLSRAAADCGYADQSHLSREIRAMAGMTPTELCASVQYRAMTSQ